MAGARSRCAPCVWGRVHGYVCSNVWTFPTLLFVTSDLFKRVQTLRHEGIFIEVGAI